MEGSNGSGNSGSSSSSSSSSNSSSSNSGSNSNNNNGGGRVSRIRRRPPSFLDISRNVMGRIASFGAEDEIDSLNLHNTSSSSIGHPSRLFSDHGKYKISDLIEKGCEPDVKRLILLNSELTDADIALLTDFPAIQMLSILNLSDVVNQNVTGSTFDQLPKSLETLILGEDLNIDDAGIGKLGHLTKLVSLSISHADNVTGSTFDLLPKSLTSLTLQYCPYVNDAGIKKLKLLPNLKELTVSHDDRITPFAFDEFPDRLERLTINNCSMITDSNINVIMTTLQRLNNERLKREYERWEREHPTYNNRGAHMHRGPHVGVGYRYIRR